MDYQKFPNKIAVLGAAGKMGSGITLLTALEVTGIRLTQSQYSNARLYALDISESALLGLRNYIQTQVRKRGEKKPELLRSLYQDNSNFSDEQLVKNFVNDVLESIVMVSDISEMKDIELIFEAVNENPELKAKLINEIKMNSSETLMVFSNTSSIPIKEIEKSTGLNGRVLGFHFYNPPAVQKLIELISTESTESSVVEFAQTFANNIKKIVVPSNDIPGFIGNGHFMRDMLFGFTLLEELKKSYEFHEAVYAVNYVSQNLLVRPMGIFQLVDYVGLDVCRNILKVMNSRITEEDLECDILENLFEQGIIGGQNSDGSQKQGIFQYEKGIIKNVFNLDNRKYYSVEDMDKVISELIQGLDELKIPLWKEIISEDKKDEKLKDYFKHLFAGNTKGSRLAFRYLCNSKKIGESLVENGVTDSDENVNKVLLLGFYHAYGPINNYC
jgi:3-hydroxyacyl-CoA dehydrogenase